MISTDAIRKNTSRINISGGGRYFLSTADLYCATIRKRSTQYSPLSPDDLIVLSADLSPRLRKIPFHCLPRLTGCPSLQISVQDMAFFVEDHIPAQLRDQLFAH